MKTIRKFTTSDGKEFTDQIEARNHQNKIDEDKRFNFFKELMGDTSLTFDDICTVYNTIKENPQKFDQLLDMFAMKHPF